MEKKAAVMVGVMATVVMVAGVMVVARDAVRKAVETGAGAVGKRAVAVSEARMVATMEVVATEVEKEAVETEAVRAA